MNLAFLGFAMIIVFMALIMAKKLSPFTSLILVPVPSDCWPDTAGILWLRHGRHQERGLYLRDDDLRDPILRLMLTAGMFDPMVDHVVAWCKGDPLKVLVGTAILAPSFP